MIIIRRIVLFLLVLCAAYFFYLTKRPRPLPVNHGNVKTQLFLGDAEDQKLLVLFGGSEGGNRFAHPEWSDFRQSFLDNGYAVLCVEYFGGKETPPVLDRIALDSIMHQIHSYQKHPLLADSLLYLYGVARGSELAMHLAIHYPEVDGIVLAAPTAITLASRYGRKETSSWMIKGEQIPFARGNKIIVKAFKEGNYFAGMLYMMQDSAISQEAVIPIWKANADILLITPVHDKVWPSKRMGEYIMNQLKKHNYKQRNKQLLVDGGHGAAVGHVDEILAFLDNLSHPK